MSGKFSWLHISDMHFQSGGDEDTKWNCFCESIKNNRDLSLCSYIFITGDIAHQGKFVDIVKERLKKLQKSFDPDICPRFFWSFGNHDISFVEDDESIRNARYMLIKDSIFKSNATYSDTYYNFKNILKNNLLSDLLLCGFEVAKKYANEHLINSDDFSYDNLGINGFYSDNNINLCVLNTSVVATEAKKGQILASTDELSNKLSSFEKSKPTFILAHHPFEFFDDYNVQNLDAALSQVDIYLCGHKHSASATEKPQGNGQSLIEIIAGSVSGVWDDLSYQNARFNVMHGLYDGNGGISIHYYTYTRDGFQWYEDSHETNRLLNNGKAEIKRLCRHDKFKITILNNTELENEKFIPSSVSDKNETDVTERCPKSGKKPCGFSCEQWRPVSDNLVSKGARNDHLKEIYDKLQENSYCFIIQESGIGKTEVAKLFTEHYGSKGTGDYLCVHFAAYKGCLKELIGELPVVDKDLNVSIDIQCEFVIKNLLSHKEKDFILVIDNFNNYKKDDNSYDIATKDPFFNSLITLAQSKGFKILFISRFNVDDSRPHVKINRLDEDTLLKLFFSICKKAKNKDNCEKIKNYIVRDLRSNTFSVVVFANLCERLPKSVDEFINYFRISRKNMSGIEIKLIDGRGLTDDYLTYIEITRAFLDVAGLNEIQKKILRGVTLISGYNSIDIKIEDFCNWIVSENIQRDEIINEINRLYDMSFLMYSDNHLWAHALTLDAINHLLNQTLIIVKKYYKGSYMKLKKKTIQINGIKFQNILA